MKYHGVYCHLMHVTCIVTVLRHIGSPRRKPGGSQSTGFASYPELRAFVPCRLQAAFSPGETDCRGAISAFLPWWAPLARCSGNSQQKCPIVVARQSVVGSPFFCSWGIYALGLSGIKSSIFGSNLVFTRRSGFFTRCIMCVKQKNQRAPCQSPKTCFVTLSADAKFVAVREGYGVC